MKLKVPITFNLVNICTVFKEDFSNCFIEHSDIGFI